MPGLRDVQVVSALREFKKLHAAREVVRLRGLLELLPRLYERVVVPSAVVAELSDGAHLGYDVPTPSTLPWVVVEAPPGAAILPMVTALGDGEWGAIALAATRKSVLLLLADALARRHARSLGLTVTGTLGRRSFERRVTASCPLAPVVDKLEQLGFALVAETRASVLRLAGNPPPSRASSCSGSMRPGPP